MFLLFSFPRSLFPFLLSSSSPLWRWAPAARGGGSRRRAGARTRAASPLSGTVSGGSPTRAGRRRTPCAKPHRGPGRAGNLHPRWGSTHHGGGRNPHHGGRARPRHEAAVGAPPHGRTQQCEGREWRTEHTGREPGALRHHAMAGPTQGLRHFLGGPAAPPGRTMPDHAPALGWRAPHAHCKASTMPTSQTSAPLAQWEEQGVGCSWSWVRIRARTLFPRANKTPSAASATCPLLHWGPPRPDTGGRRTGRRRRVRTSESPATWSGPQGAPAEAPVRLPAVRRAPCRLGLRAVSAPPDWKEAQCGGAGMERRPLDGAALRSAPGTEESALLNESLKMGGVLQNAGAPPRPAWGDPQRLEGAPAPGMRRTPDRGPT